MDPRTVPPPVSNLPLWSGHVDVVNGKPVGVTWTRLSPTEHGRAGMEHHHTEGPSALLKEQLVTLATELLKEAGAFGVTFGEVRLAAETRGWLTGHEYGRWLSCGDQVMRKARGKKGGTNGRRKSTHGNSHRRKLTVHVHEDFCK